jgi:hypothetical protein
MKRVIGPILGAVSLTVLAPAAATAQPARAAQGDLAAKTAEAHAIIEIMFPPAERQQIFETLVAQLSNQFRAATMAKMPLPALDDPGFKAILNEYLDKVTVQQKVLIHKHLPDIMEANALAYTHEFSLAELKDIHAFATTPSGRHYLGRSTAILSDPAVVKVNSAMMKEAQQVSFSLMPEMRDKIVAYMKAHPELAEKIAAQSEAK